MTTVPWQFSLRSLFVAVTLIAASIVLAIHFPGIVIIGAAFALPFVSGRAMAHFFHRAPGIARIIMATCCAAFLIASGFLFLQIERAGELFGLGLLCSFGLLCGFVAWLIPDKRS